MVDSDNMNDKMIKYLLWYCIVLFTLLEVCVRTQISVHHDTTTTHTFVQNQNEVRYLVDEMSTIHKELASGKRNAKVVHDNRFNSLLRFQPEFLDFKDRPLGIPYLEKVTLFNMDNNRTIDLISISGNTVHFHSSFFQHKKIPPLGNTTFNVVFLGREEGEIESNLFIHTTEGIYKYHVCGTSLPSPYRLRPIVDVHVPLNATFSPLIYMHNPHTLPIQIIEVYSSGGEFHLELPSGELEGPKGMWEIGPFETKPIIRIRFNARNESSYTAYVRIKVKGMKDMLVVPLEVKVSGQCGLHVAQGSVDFGVGGTLDQSKRVKLHVHNTFKKMLRIQSVSVSSKAIRIVDFQPIKIAAETKQPVHIATLHFNWRNAYETKDFFGRITLKLKQNKSEQLDIPFWATVLDGGLLYNTSITKYLTSALDYRARNFTVINKYESALMVVNVSLSTDAASYFSISKFKAVILQPKHSTVVLFELTLKPEMIVSKLKFKSFLIIHTNISDVQVPLFTYDGKLTMSISTRVNDDDNNNELNLGLIGLETRKETHFLLTNNNPVDVELLDIGTSNNDVECNLITCGKHKFNVDDDDLANFSAKNMTKCSVLKSGEYAVFKVVVLPAKTEQQQLVQTFVQTNYEKIMIPIRYKIAQGKIEIGIEETVQDCFPGKICTYPLRIHSTFVDSMVIENISSIAADSSISFFSLSNIITNCSSSKIVGHLLLNPVLDCQDCYTGFNNDSVEWFNSLSLPSNTSDLDLSLFNRLYQRYSNVSSDKKVTLRLDTTQVRAHLFEMSAKMIWPKLVVAAAAGTNMITFPLTQIGQVSLQNITIRNPSNDVTLRIQLVMDWAYPRTKHLIKQLPSKFISSNLMSDYSQAFFFYLHPTNGSGSSLLLEPLGAGETVHVTVAFKAGTGGDGSKSTILYIRNNLTVLEMIRLSGQTAQPAFKFGNRKSGSPLPLLFELSEKRLKDCDRKKNPPTVKRSFLAKNTGDISIHIKTFYINNLQCEGYGFKVLNCLPFELQPNSTRKVDIAFTPDFTLSKIQRTLILETSLMNQPTTNYTLMTTVPSLFLTMCANNIFTRPHWEPYLYYISLTLMLFLLGFVLLVCYAESHRILTSCSLSRKNGVVEETAQPLDLRLIGTQARNEIQAAAVKIESIEYDSTSNLVVVKNQKKKCCKKNSGTVLLDEVNKKKLKMDRTKNENRIQKEIVRKMSKPHSSEEETSSTTTESSTSGGDVIIEKVNESKKLIVGKKMDKIVPPPPPPPPVQQQQILCDECSEYNGEKKKCNKQLKSAKAANYSPTTTTTKSSRQCIRKEKLNQKKRTSIDKKSTINQSSSSSFHRNDNGVGAVISSNRWSESRATFSDVVSRSDPPKKPTLCVEPTQKQKESSAELGPIGSKKPTPPTTTTGTNYYYYYNNNNIQSLSNSFFTEPLENTNSYLDLQKIWHNSQDNNVCKEPISLCPSPPPFQETWHEASFWEPLCAPVGEVKPQQQQQQQSNDYFWTASSSSSSLQPVWSSVSPWTTTTHEFCDTVNTPTQICSPPPGFGSEENDAHRIQNYELFNNTLNNIWTPHTPDPWTFNNNSHTHNP